METSLSSVEPGLGDPGTLADYQGWREGREQLKEARKDRGWRMGGRRGSMCWPRAVRL